MDWNQIESKWAVMIRRVSSDVSVSDADLTAMVVRPMGSADTKTVNGDGRQASVSLEQGAPMSTQ